MCRHFITIDYMRLLMDADCLIKLTKAGLKDLVAEYNPLFIPAEVEKEVVDTGKDKGCADAFIVEGNIKAQKLTLIESTVQHLNGDEALTALFRADRYDAVATDDAKLVRRFRMHNIPYVLPALILFRLWWDKVISRELALSSLEQLSEFISEEEYSTVRLLMEKPR
jgi:rRNA-processing protein FCF1